VSHSFRYIPRSWIARSYGRSMFRFLRSLQIFFQSGCTSLHSHQQCTWVPFSPHPHQHMLLLVFLMMAILTGGTLIHYNNHKIFSISFRISPCICQHFFFLQFFVSLSDHFPPAWRILWY
jgi:hypothetical protein